MPARSLAPRALYEEVAELLRQRIFSRELEPGSWIDELKIAEAYGISRTPLREALKVLAAEGLVTMKVRRGAYVTEVSDRDLADVYHLRRHLEKLQERSELAEAMHRVVTAPEPLQLDTMRAYQLYSMGLVRKTGDQVSPRCRLYQDYFQTRLSNPANL